ncbi:MAG: hypothetical protein KF779_13165 [Hyphomonadaceae bacterium]|nr:hypothetical protein [Hyphomonadaceae bacterium]
MRAELRDEDMVMWQVHPRRDHDWKAVFHVLDADHWVRTEYVRDYGTDDWTPTGRLSATQVACSEVRVP